LIYFILLTGALPIRFILPPTFLVLSLAHFLPKTASNLSAYYTRLEQTYAPGWSSQRTELSRSIGSSLSGASKSYQDLKGAAGDKVQWARTEVEGRTGLKVGNLEGGIQELAQDIGSKVMAKVGEVEKQVESVVVEEKRTEEEPKRLV